MSLCEKKSRSRRYPAETITNTDYADDLALLANTSATAESLLHSLKHAVGGIDHHVNANKTEYMCFKQGAISIPRGERQKLVHKFMDFGSSISSTESDVNIFLAKAWPANDGLAIIWKSDLSDEIKWDFLQAVVVSILLYKCTTWTLTKCIEKKLDGNKTRMLRAILNKFGKHNPTKQQLYGHLPPISITIVVR